MYLEQKIKLAKQILDDDRDFFSGKFFYFDEESGMIELENVIGATKNGFIYSKLPSIVADEVSDLFKNRVLTKKD